jgi:hypothetical protein
MLWEGRKKIYAREFKFLTKQVLPVWSWYIGNIWTSAYIGVLASIHYDTIDNFNMKKYLPFLFLVSFISVAHADVPKVFHVIKAKIKSNNKSYVTYALVVGELNHYDSMIRVYKKDSKRFTLEVKQLMIWNDSLSLYSKIFRVKEKNLILLPKDKESKISLMEIQDIVLIEYFPSEYAGGQVFTNVLSSDSTWVSWKVSQTENFGTTGDSGICGFTVLYFNKPDNISKAVVKTFESTIRDREEKSIRISEEEIDIIKERLRKLRIVVLYYCGC